MKGFIVMRKGKGFASIEVMLISLACSIIITILMDSSFQRRKEVNRSYGLINDNIEMFKDEEEFLKYIIKENILNKEKIEELNFNLDNMSVTYDSTKDVLHIKNKNNRTGVLKNTYYGIAFSEDESITLSKRRCYEFTN